MAGILEATGFQDRSMGQYNQAPFWAFSTARHFAEAGVSTMNIPTDLSPAQIGGIRQAVEIPIDLYIEVPDNFGGFIRYYEMPLIIRVAAPVYFKFGLRNAPDIYPSGRHLEDLAFNMGRAEHRSLPCRLESAAWSQPN